MIDDTPEVRVLVERAWAAFQNSQDARDGPYSVAQEDLEAAFASLGIPFDTLAGLSAGRLVAVPREATEAMMEAGGAVMGGGNANIAGAKSSALWIYAAMLRAAPDAGRRGEERGGRDMKKSHLVVGSPVPDDVLYELLPSNVRELLMPGGKPARFIVPAGTHVEIQGFRYKPGKPKDGES